MSALLAFFKSLYEHKEKVILGLLIVAFGGVAYQQYKAKKNNGTDSNSPVNNGFTPAPERAPGVFKVPPLSASEPLETYYALVEKRDIFEIPEKKSSKTEAGTEEVKWANISIKSVFDPTRSGSFIAIIEVDGRREFVKEGEQFGEYEVRRIDGVRKCLTIFKRGSKSGEDEKEFCKEEE